MSYAHFTDMKVDTIQEVMQNYPSSRRACGGEAKVAYNYTCGWEATLTVSMEW